MTRGSERGPAPIDAHVHVGPPYRPVEAYIAEMGRLGLERAVLVQAIGNHDDRYLAACLAAYPGRFAAIGSVDAGDEHAVARLGGAVRTLGLQGLRLAPAARSPGRDPLAVWRRADDLGLVVSVRGPFEDVVDDAFAAIVAACPRVRFRLEHLGWLKLAGAPPPGRPFERFLRLADYPNTSVMWSGFYLNSGTPYPYPGSRAVVERAYRAFGAERTMWSGDWNRPALGDDEYERELELVGGAFPVDSEADRVRIMAGTALELFDFERQPDPPAGR